MDRDICSSPPLHSHLHFALWHQQCRAVSLMWPPCTTPKTLLSGPAMAPVQKDEWPLRTLCCSDEAIGTLHYSPVFVNNTRLSAKGSTWNDFKARASGIPKSHTFLIGSCLDLVAVEGFHRGLELGRHNCWGSERPSFFFYLSLFSDNFLKITLAFFTKDLDWQSQRRWYKEWSRHSKY